MSFFTQLLGLIINEWEQVQTPSYLLSLMAKKLKEPMQIFGHAGSTETFTFNDLNEVYIKHRDNNELLIVSDEMGKSKPASLFFLSKFGCLLEKVKFYSNTTINTLWDEVDVLLTANPDLIVNHPKDKVVVKFLTAYNKNVNSDYEIKSLKEFDEIIEKL
jgi:hypothetical protein